MLREYIYFCIIFASFCFRTFDSNVRKQRNKGGHDPKMREKIRIVSHESSHYPRSGLAKGKLEGFTNPVGASTPRDLSRFGLLEKPISLITRPTRKN